MENCNFIVDSSGSQACGNKRESAAKVVLKLHRLILMKDHDMKGSAHTHPQLSRGQTVRFPLWLEIKTRSSHTHIKLYDHTHAHPLSTTCVGSVYVTDTVISDK